MYAATLTALQVNPNVSTLRDTVRLDPCAGIPFESQQELDQWVTEICNDFDVSVSDAQMVAREVFGIAF